MTRQWAKHTDVDAEWVVDRTPGTMLLIFLKLKYVQGSNNLRGVKRYFVHVSTVRIVFDQYV